MSTTYKGIEVFDGRNYTVWALQLKIYLQSKGVFTLALEGDPVDPNDAGYALWLAANLKSHTIITRTLTSELNILYADQTHAKFVWDAIKLRYSLTNVTSQILSFEQLASHTLKEW